MKRLRKMGGTRKYETFDHNEAKSLALDYAKQDGIDYAVIQTQGNEPFEIIQDDMDQSPEHIPGIVYHTSEDIKDIDDYNQFSGKNRERMEE